MAWKVELDRGAVRDLDKLDRRTARRILAFLHERVARLDDPRTIGEALKGSDLGEFCAIYPSRAAKARSQHHIFGP